MEDRAAENTDRLMWREERDDPFAASLHVTKSGGIGINVGGHVIVKPLREWHALAVAGSDPGIPVYASRDATDNVLGKDGE